MIIDDLRTSDKDGICNKVIATTVFGDTFQLESFLGCGDVYVTFQLAIGYKVKITKLELMEILFGIGNVYNKNITFSDRQ